MNCKKIKRKKKKKLFQKETSTFLIFLKLATVAIFGSNKIFKNFFLMKDSVHFWQPSNVMKISQMLHLHGKNWQKVSKGKKRWH